MRIFSAVRHSLDPKYYYGGLWSGMFHPALGRLGHEVTISNVDLKLAWDLASGSPEQKQKRAEITEQILDEVRSAHARQPVDLFLSYFYDAHFDPDGFEEIHRLGIPTVNFYCNSVYQLELVSQIAAKVKYSWHSERHADGSYRRIGANPVWVQLAADPDVYRPIAQASRKRAACFIGQRYADRDRWAATLIRADIPLELYGSGWGNALVGVEGRPGGTVSSYWSTVRRNLGVHGPVGGLVRTWNQWAYRNQTRSLTPLLTKAARGPAQDIAETLAEHEVVLNFSNVWADGRPGSVLIPHVRLRDFEAPMCRTCYLTGDTDEIADFYVIGKEIDTYRTTDELVEKVRFYLTHPTAAERLREAGYQRARRDHTWERRFEELFRKTGIGG